MKSGTPTPASSPRSVVGDERDGNGARTISAPRPQELRRIELRSRRQVTGDLLGQYRSAFRGTGLIYSDIREYQPGDDVKHIHWKVTARTGTVYVKSYEEDRQLRVVLAVDVSASLGSPWHEQTFSKALQFCSLVSTLTQRGNDLIGTCLFAKEVIQFLPPKSGAHRHHQVISTLASRRPTTTATDLRPMLNHLMTNMKRPAIVFIVSDFFCPPFDRELKNLAKRHDVILVQLEHSPDALPDVGVVSFADAETGEQIDVDTSDKRTRAAFVHMVTARRKALAEIAREAGTDHLFVQQNVVAPLATLMRERNIRIKR